MLSSAQLSRRAFCGAVALAAAPAVARAQVGDDHGKVNPPVAAPAIGLVRHDGVATRLPALVQGRATAMQIMFTACATACPIEGAIFARVQKLLPDQTAQGIQLLSLSVDPKNDTPDALSAWLRRFHAAPGWIAAAPAVTDVEQVKAFAGRGRNPADNHSTQVLMINRSGLLVWRTFELPEAEEIASMLRKM
jgi:protein SCO1/2